MAALFYFICFIWFYRNRNRKETFPDICNFDVRNIHRDDIYSQEEVSVLCLFKGSFKESDIETLTLSYASWAVGGGAFYARPF